MANSTDGAAPEALLARVPSLAGTPRVVTALPGGLTNENFKVTTPDGVYVARLFSDGGELLGIDREREYQNSVIAAAAGVGAPVIEYRPEERVLVLGFVEGRTLTNADVAQPGMLERVARVCARLHGAGRFAGDFDMFEVQAAYLADRPQARAGHPGRLRRAAASLRRRPRRPRRAGGGHGAV